MSHRNNYDILTHAMFGLTSLYSHSYFITVDEKLESNPKPTARNYFKLLSFPRQTVNRTWFTFDHSRYGGLQPGDIITHIDGTPIRHADDIYKILAKGDVKSLKISVSRHGKTVNLTIIPEDVSK